MNMNTVSISKLVDLVVESSKDNSSGMLVPKKGIRAIIMACLKEDFSIAVIDREIENNEAIRSGFLVKTSDFLLIKFKFAGRYVKI